jgi:hypothetical protein
MQFFRFLAVLMCAEWLLIFHVWISFRYLLVFAIFAYFRGQLLAFIPHWDTYYFVFLFAVLGVLYHLRSVWRGRSARYRDFYTTPDAGVPWLIMVAQTPKATQLLEYVLMMAFLIYMMSYGHLIYPRDFRALPPDWQAWLSAPGNAELFSAAYAISAMFGLSLWNLAASGVPFRKSSTANAETYPYVREASHSAPRLPTVKELADEHRELYG